MRRHISTTASITVLVLAMASTPSPALAQSRAYAWSMRETNLSNALRDFAQKTRQQLVFTESLTAGKRAPAIIGNFSADEALRRLLSRTGLVARRMASNVILIEREAAVVPPSSAKPSYAGAVAPSLTAPGPRSADAPLAIEEIIVTARRRQESQQKVPIAITSFTQKELTQRNIKTDADLLRGVTSVGVFGFRDSSYISIRGQAGRGAVVTYLNEVPIPESTDGFSGVGVGGPAVYYDMESVQVLKGPQGTLFGRNTTGGAVLYQTKAPANELGASAELALGNHKDREANGTLNIPIVKDRLLFRVAGTVIKRDGFTHAAATPSHPNGIDLDNRNAWSVRGTLVAKPTDAIENKLVVSYMHNKNHGSSLFLTDLNPAQIFGLFGVIQAFPGIADVLQQQKDLGIRKQVALGNDPGYDASFLTATDTLNARLSDEISLRTILNYSRLNVYNFATDADGTTFPILAIPANNVRTRTTNQYSAEVQLRGMSFENKLDWVLGGLYLDSPPQNGFGVTRSQVFGADTYNENRTGTRSVALYGQASYDLSSLLEGLKATVGVRETWDKLFQQDRNGGLTPGACVVPPPRADANCVITSRAKFNAPTWLAGLDYQINPTTLVYFASRRGYRQGGVNVTKFTSEFTTYAPEYVTDFEFGMKTDWSIGRIPIRTNLALYRQIYRDIQVQIAVQDGAGISGVIQNGAGARIQGFEFEGRVRPVSGLELGGAFSFLDFKYTKFSPGADVVSLQQGAIENRPRFKYGLNADYEGPLPGQIGTFVAHADWNWQSGTYKRPGPPIDTHFGILNASVGLRNLGGTSVDATLFATNLTNAKYIAHYYGLYPYFGFNSVSYSEPRMYGLRLSYAFGG